MAEEPDYEFAFGRLVGVGFIVLGLAIVAFANRSPVSGGIGSGILCIAMGVGQFLNPTMLWGDYEERRPWRVVATAALAIVVAYMTCTSFKSSPSSRDRAGCARGHVQSRR